MVAAGIAELATFTMVDAGIVGVTVVCRTQTATTATVCCTCTMTVNRLGGRMCSSPAAISGSDACTVNMPLLMFAIAPVSGMLPDCAPASGRAPLNETAEVPAGYVPPRPLAGDESMIMSVWPTVFGPDVLSVIGIRSI